MLKFIVFIFSLFALAACQTAPGAVSSPPSPAEISAKVCPPLEAVLVVLAHADSATIQPETKAQIAAIQPLVATACAAGAALDDLHVLADRGLPMALGIVDVLPLTEQQRNTAVLAIAVAQAAISAAR